MDRSGRTHVIRMIKVDHICDPQRLPNFENIQKRFPWLPPGCLERPKTSIGILLGQNGNMFFPGSEEDARCGNMRVRRTILGDWGYVPDGYDKCMWEFERKPRTHLLQKVIPSSFFQFTTPDLPWIQQLPWINIFWEFLNSEPTIIGDLSERWPPVLSFIEDGYAKMDIQP